MSSKILHEEWRSEPQWTPQSWDLKTIGQLSSAGLKKKMRLNRALEEI